jgi:phosphatidylserine/phosphatidylglycerophosphate/cardiolipin synthase-like enzyme
MTVGDLTETGGPSDGDATLMGSMNWTNAAARNSEDLNLVASRPVAEAYAAHWRERLAVSVRFDSSEDWCRVSSAGAPSGTH